MKKWLLGITCMLMMLGLIFSAGCGKQPASPASDRLEVRNNGTAIQWKYSDETDWHDLVALTELRGAAGENGKNGTDGKDGINGSDGKDGINGTNGKDGINGVDGKDGIDGKDGANGKDGINAKNIEVQRAGTHIQWRYEGDEWQNLVAIYRPVPVYLLLGAACARSCKGKRNSAQSHSYNKQGRGAKRPCSRHDLCAVPRREICNSCDTVG